MTYQRKDYFFHQAKKRNYVARSIFKLEEIDQRFKIFKPHYKVLDLGAAPGSWLQYACQKIGSQGKILGIDLEPIAITLPNTLFLQANLTHPEIHKKILATGIQPPFDVVLSDMAPKTTGIRTTDQARSLELCEIAFQIAVTFLKKNGSFICKFFHSEAFDILRNQLKENFSNIQALRPQSTRKASQEIFLIGLQKK